MAGAGDTGTSADTLPGASGEEERGVRVAREPVVGLTIAWHPEVARIGERAALLRTAATALSRLEPSFAAPGATRGRGLDERHVSRCPIALRSAADGVHVAAGDAGTRVTIG